MSAAAACAMQDTSTFDIHDRVNYSVKKSTLKINEDRTLVKLKLTVDTHYRLRHGLF